MADDKKDEDSGPKRGVLLRPEPPLPLTARTGQQRTMDWLLSRLSRWPFQNRKYVEALKTAQEVLEARTQLGKTYIEHEEIRDDVQNIQTTIAQRRLRRLREYFEEESKFTAVLNDSKMDLEMMDEKNERQREALRKQQRDQEIERMRQEKSKAVLQKELEELRKPPPAPEPPKKTTRGRSPKQKKREEVLTKYEKEMARIEAMKKTDKAKATLRKAAEAEKEKEMAEIENMP